MPSAARPIVQMTAALMVLSEGGITYQDSMQMTMRERREYLRELIRIKTPPPTAQTPGG